jgi:RES domain-containing protein
VTRIEPSPWTGIAYRHVRANANRDVLDFSFAGTFGRNRWNQPGEPTLYLAGDPGVLVAEWGRQLLASVSADVAAQTIERDVYRLHLRLDRTLDLRSPAVARQLGVTDLAAQATDRDAARAIAARVRSTTTAQAILVPSIAFIDDLTRWNLVVFLDRTPTDTAAWIRRVDYVGPLRWR